MIKKIFSPARFGKIIFVTSAILAFFAFRDTWLFMREQGYAFGQSKRLVLLIALGINMLGVFLVFRWDSYVSLKKLSGKISPNHSLKIFSVLAVVIGSLIPPLITLFDPSHFILSGFPMAWVTWWLSILMMVILYIGFQQPPDILFAISLLSIGFMARIESWLPSISSYPFSLGWSEASRYYFASLFFSEKLYGETLAWSFLHPSRYLLQSIPFFFGAIPLWAHRVWQVLLWLGITFCTSVAFVRRLTSPKKALLFWSLTIWFFLYLFQGAVYYHLQIAVLIILVGVHPAKPKRSFWAVILASLWAGISRINWVPVPAMLAILIFLLEEPVSDYKNLWHYLRKPLLWTIFGTGTALASQSLYVIISHNTENIASFSSSFTSLLLWYRLLPNQTYPPGILFGTMLVSFPLLGIIAITLSDRRKNWRWIRLFGTFAILSVLLLGGLTVSAKIGGGADLHNMDAYLLALGVWAGTLFLKRTANENPNSDAAYSIPAEWIAIALIIPVWLSLQSMNPMPQYDLQHAETSLEIVRDAVSKTAAQKSEVLFLNQRHLLTFGMVDNIDLVPEYEVITLMEMAISNNTAYLDQFHNDLLNQRFGLIVASTQYLGFKKEREAFAEENNAWIKNISEYLVCTYEAQTDITKENIVLFVPKKNVAIENCKFTQ